MRPARRLERGFTLIEAIAVVVITGIVAGMVALFIRKPVEGYFDTARRAQLADIADTAVRRIERDLQAALPNSVRIGAAGAKRYVEFLHVKSGGRYRAELDDAGAGDPLDFTSGSDGGFDVLGFPVTVAAGDQLVVYNLGMAGADAYAGDNRRAITSSGDVASLAFTATGTPLPLASPGQRFQVVDTPVSYECDPAAGTLRRYWGYAIAASQPMPPAGGASALLADRVGNCDFAYEANVANQRSGLVSLRLQLTAAGETATLFQQVHVSNLP